MESLVQGEHLPGHLGADGSGVVALLDVTVALDQVDHRKIRRGLAIGNRGALQDQPPLGAVAVDDLIDQTRLPHPGLADDGHQMAMLRSGLRQGLA
jgi:hypothetical protein